MILPLMMCCHLRMRKSLLAFDEFFETRKQKLYNLLRALQIYKLCFKGVYGKRL